MLLSYHVTRGLIAMTRFDLEGFVTEEDPRGRNVSLQFAPLCYVIAQQHPR